MLVIGFHTAEKKLLFEFHGIVGKYPIVSAENKAIASLDGK